MDDDAVSFFFVTDPFGAYNRHLFVLSPKYDNMFRQFLAENMLKKASFCEDDW